MLRAVATTIFMAGGLMLSGVSGALAQTLATGEQVYTAVCSVCHATGVAKAPKFGDAKAWRPLIKEGQHVLTAHAWVGVRGMPARGGKPELSLEEFSRAAAYMTRAAGSRWQDPDAAMLGKIDVEVRKRVAQLEKKH